MNVLLINPPSPHVVRGSLPPVIEDDTGVYPPLGLLYVAAHAQTVRECNVTVLDCQAEGVTHEMLGSRISGISPDVIGVQVMTFTLIDAVILAKTLRRLMPGAYIVFGGPHATIYAAETVRIPEIDAVIPGEGEYVFAELLKALVKKQSPESVKGVITEKNPGGTVTWDHIADLDRLLMPARDLIDNTKYTSPMVKKNPITTIMSSRGCPARCVFCDRPQMGKRFRKRSAGNVVDEMQYCCNEFDIGEFVFYDDTFTVDKQRVLDICRIIAERKLKLNWDIRARIDTVTEEMIYGLHQAGCHRIHYGVETGSPRIQRRLQKNLDLQRIKHVFSMTKKAGIETLGYFMIGCPDETEEDMKQTFDFMQSLPMDYAHISVFTPYPGTRIYQEALETGFYAHDYWKEFAENPSPGFSPRYWNQFFSDKELLVLLKKSYARFYGRPSYLVSRLLKTRSLDELGRKIILGFKLLKSTYQK